MVMNGLTLSSIIRASSVVSLSKTYKKKKKKRPGNYKRKATRNQGDQKKRKRKRKGKRTSCTFSTIRYRTDPIVALCLALNAVHRI